MAITAFAGPLSNIILAFVFYVIYLIITPSILTSYFNDGMQVLSYIALICYYVVQINISLAVFNLIPIPPLDGSRLLSAFLSDRNYYKLMQYERYFFYGIILLLFTGVIDIPLNFLRTIIFKLFELLTFWI
jgi:Zn-dependent protease